MKGRHVWLLLGLAVLVVGLMAHSPATQAAGNDAEGYCAADGTPVITYWPPGWEGNYDAACVGKQLSLHYKYEIPLDGKKTSWEDGVLERPEDWGRWVYLTLNDFALYNPYYDVEPYVVKSTGRTLIPLRFVSEAFGARVIWNGETQSVTIDWRDHQIKVTVGAETAWVDEKKVTLDQPAQIWKDRTMVPLRFVAESFGAEVSWDAPTSQVFINLPGATCPPTYCYR